MAMEQATDKGYYTNVQMLINVQMAESSCVTAVQEV